MSAITVHRDMRLELRADDVWRCMGGAQSRRAALEDEVEEAVAEAARLATPAAVSTTRRLESAGRRTAYFDGGTVLDGRMLPHLLEGAAGAVFLMATAGPGIERRVAELFAEGDALRAFVLDAAGSATAMAVFTSAATDVGEELSAVGERIGPCIRPGTDAWAIEGQRPIFEMLPSSEIGVQLLDSLLMYPQKTQSGMIPFGQALRVVDEPGSAPCRRCSAVRCPMRVEPYAGSPGEPQK